jgi:hypothetical protein
MTNIGNENALWMTRIAGFTQQIIINSSDELLKDPILPLAEKLHKKTEAMFHKEESVRGFLKAGTDDTSQVCTWTIPLIWNFKNIRNDPTLLYSVGRTNSRRMATSC